MVAIYYYRADKVQYYDWRDVTLRNTDLSWPSRLRHYFRRAKKQDASIAGVLSSFR